MLAICIVRNIACWLFAHGLFTHQIWSYSGHCSNTTSCTTIFSPLWAIFSGYILSPFVCSLMLYLFIVECLLGEQSVDPMPTNDLNLGLIFIIGQITWGHQVVYSVLNKLRRPVSHLLSFHTYMPLLKLKPLGVGACMHIWHVFYSLCILKCVFLSVVSYVLFWWGVWFKKKKMVVVSFWKLVAWTK
jgi:hypothetical protein